MFKFFLDTWYIWIFVILATVLRIFKPTIKGWIGEKKIALYLSTLPKAEYTLLNDIMLSTESGTTQIDHIVVSKYGVFIIETKNYIGWIYGSENSAQWTQNIYGHKTTFMNPLRQNYAHTKAIESRLSHYNNIPIISIIAFSGGCELKVKTTKHVVYFRQVRKVIRTYKQEVLAPEDIPVISELIKNSNINNVDVKKEHVQMINQKKTTIETTTVGSKCPKCDGVMIERRGKSGAFIGCSQYPKCRFTKVL